MRKLVLYNAKRSEGQSFVGVKKCVVPNQSMTLQEILRRFVKRESLPVQKEGSYEEGEYDLEKLAHEDPVIKAEVLAEVREDVKRKKKKVDELTAMEKAKKEAREKKEAEFDEFMKRQSDPKKDTPSPSGT